MEPASPTCDPAFSCPISFWPGSEYLSAFPFSGVPCQATPGGSTSRANLAPLVRYAPPVRPGEPPLTRISIILPARNEVDGLRKTLPALRDAIPGTDTAPGRALRGVSRGIGLQGSRLCQPTTFTPLRV